MGVKLSNNASSRLSGSITNSATSLSVEDASAFPALGAGDWFPATIVDSLANREVVKVTARSGATFTIVRGQEGTAARAFNAGSRIDLRATTAALQALVTDAVAAEAADRDTAISAEATARDNAIASEATARANADNVRIKFLGSGVVLPTSDIGPIWHTDYNDIMTWQVFNANGANYTGYASRSIGQPRSALTASPPAGFLKRNGASLSRTTYAALRGWAMHNGLFVAAGSWAAGTGFFCDNADGTTFKVPDVRGEHLRYWDDGRGVDTGRAIGTWQDSQNKAHTHGVNDPTHSHYGNFGSYTIRHSFERYSDVNAEPAGGYSGAAYTGISIQSSGGTEARVRTVAELATIKF